MKSSLFNLLIAGMLVTPLAVTAVADDAKDDAIKKDHQLIEGTWRIVGLETDGNKADGEDLKRLKVVNGADGTWSLRTEGQEISKGTSTIDPTKKPKTIDFTPTEGSGKDNHYVGIYEITGNTRKVCFGPAGKERPIEFSAPTRSQYTLVIYEREK